MQLGVGLRDERRRDGVDVSQPLVDDVPNLSDATSDGDEGQAAEGRDGDDDPGGQPGRNRGRRRHAAIPANTRTLAPVSSDAHAYATAATGTEAASSRRPSTVDDASHWPLPRCVRREPRRSASPR